MLLVAVAILTFSSLVYFAEKEGYDQVRTLHQVLLSLSAVAARAANYGPHSETCHYRRGRGRGCN